jgi:predicted DNA-binding transcriptional regulator YafY
MPQTALCDAIRTKNVVQIYYVGGAAIGYRAVEPHMVAYNGAGHLSLSAWCLSGASESQENQGWREYLLSEITNVTVLPEKFYRPRPGYDPTGGKRFHNVQCTV